MPCLYTVPTVLFVATLLNIQRKSHTYRLKMSLNSTNGKRKQAQVLNKISYLLFNCYRQLIVSFAMEFYVYSTCEVLFLAGNAMVGMTIFIGPIAQ